MHGALLTPPSPSLHCLCSRKSEPGFLKLLRSPGIDSQLRRAGTATLFDVLARQATWVGGIDSLASIPGLSKHLQIRILDQNKIVKPT